MSIFILFFFLSLDLVKSMAGEREGVNDVTRGRILACYKSVCVCVCSEGTQASVFYLWRYLIGCRVSCFRSAPGPDIFSLKQAANTKAG